MNKARLFSGLLLICSFFFTSAFAQITLNNVSYVCQGNGTYDINFTISGASPTDPSGGYFSGYYVDAGSYMVTDCFDSSSYCQGCPCIQIYDPVCMCNGVQANNSQCASLAGYSSTPGECTGNEQVAFTITGVPVGQPLDITYLPTYPFSVFSPLPYTFAGPSCISCGSLDSLYLINLYNSTGGGTDTAWTSEWDLLNAVNTWDGVIVGYNPDPCFVESLTLDFNDLEGTIPNIQLPLLRYLNLAGNNLTGAIPPFTSLWSLEEMFFSVNKLEGPVPNFASLPNLKKLHFHTNNIAGALPNFSALPNLRELSASNNKLDSLPPFTNFQASNQPFDLIEVDSNRLTFDDILPLLNLNYGTNGTLRYQGQDSVFTDTTISVSLGGNLTIDLGFDEGISNNIYTWYKGNTPIETIIGDNSRTFSNIQPSQLGVYYVSVTNPMAPQLVLHSRPITLTALPPCNPQQDRLNLIDFYNAMGGNTAGWNVDDHWEMGNNLQNWYGIQVNAQGCVVTIDLDNNTSNPDWVASPNGQGNNLVGQLPQSLFNLPYLEKLFLRNNIGITGPLPNAVGDLTQLKELSLSKTGLVNAIPPAIGNLDSLVYFEIDHTNISGPLPDEIGYLPTLRYLEIDHNSNLDGALPTTLGNLLSLQGLYANHCNFDGPIPPGLAMLPQLNTLELQHNNLEGTIPVFSGSVLLGLRLDTNRLENLPPLMLSSLGNNPWQGLQVQMNRLTFEDILPNMSIFNSNPPSNYAQQDKVYHYDTVTVNIGEDFKVNMDFDIGISPANQFVWYKGQNVVNATPIGNNETILTVSGISDEGDYYCEIKNPAAPDLTLQSYPIHLIVAPCPSTTLDSVALLADPVCSGQSNALALVSLPFNIPSPISIDYQVDNGSIENLTLPVVGGAVNFQTSGPLSPGTHNLQVSNITDANGCTYTQVFNQAVVVYTPSSAFHILYTLCAGESIVVNNTVYNEANPSGSEILPNADFNGCDSTVNINLSFYPEAVLNLSQMLCTGGSLIVNGTVYDENNPSGTEVLAGASWHGCDSTVNVSLTFGAVATGTLSQALCPGGSLTVNGTVYNASNPSGSQTFPNGSWQGCDSTVNINLSFYPEAVLNLSQVLCTGGSLIVNGTVYDENNPSGTEVLAGASWHGCDSTVNVSLTFGAVATGTLSQALCPGGSLTVNGTVYDVSNPSGSQTFPNGSWQGCDSMLSVSLTFYPDAVFSLNQSICTGGSLTVNGTVYDENNPSGTEVLAGASWHGCDSTVNVSLTFGAVATGTLSQTLCPGGSLTVNGTVYDQANPNGTETFPNGSWQGCDSTLSVSLTFYPDAVFSLNQSICTGGSLMVNGTVYDEDNPTGVEVLQGVSWHGCDSTVNVSLTFGAVATGTLSQTLCPGGSLTVNGTVYNEDNPSGTETLLNGGWQGCDSTITVSLSFQSLDAADDNFPLPLNTLDLHENLVLNDDLPAGGWTLTGIQDPGSGSLVYEGQNSGEFTWTTASYVPAVEFTYEVCAVDCPDLCDIANVTITLEPNEVSSSEPDGFTPNGDGKNDEFIIPELLDPTAYPENELTVFSRWGDVVFHAKPYLNNWDGGDLPAGTYFYVIRLDVGEGEIRMKQVVIIR